MKQIGLLGAAHIHVPGFINAVKRREGQMRVKAVWDHDAARSKKRADEVGGETVADFRQLLDDKSIDAIVVCSETNLHEKLVLPAAEAGKPLFVEKPLGMGAKDAYAIADAIEKNKCLFQTGYFMRGEPHYLFLKQHVAQGTFGRITRVRGSNCHEGAVKGWFDTEWRWMADPAQSGVGGFGDLGTHSLDLLLWLMGDVESATAVVDNGTRRYTAGGVTCDETGEGLIRFRNGTIGTLAAGWVDAANPVQMIISGTDAHAVVIAGQVHLKSRTMAQYDGSAPLRAAELPPRQSAGFELFLDAVEGKAAASSLVSVREAAYRVAVMEAMYEGARGSKWVAPR